MINPPSPPPDEMGSEPADPDTAPGRNAGSASPSRDRSVLAAVAIGGALGALARWSAGAWWPNGPGSFLWTTFGINVVGCALIGLLMVLVTDVYSNQRLLRPFVVTGILGGFTTFSTYSVDTERLLQDDHPVLALTYAALTLVVAIAAVTAATLLTRHAYRRTRSEPR